ncbi:MAG TPA: hypothetical protein VF604_05625 [Pyrinomonadaceae bacterium]
MSNASDPQWMCSVNTALGRGFWGAPTHCQRAMLQNASFGNLYYDEIIKLKFVPFATDSPVKPTIIPFDAMPTDKRNDSTAAAFNPIPKSSIPSVDGKKDKDPDIDLENRIVTVRDNTVPGYVDVSQSGAQTKESENLKNFRRTIQSVREILQENNGSNPCAKFFGRAGLDALNAIEAAVNARGENAFADLGLGTSSTGIRMTIPLEVSADIAPIITTDIDGKGVYGAVAPLNNQITINTRGAFAKSQIMGGTLPSYGGYRPGTPGSRITQILHEIGHLVITEASQGIHLYTEKGKNPKIFQQRVFHHLLAPDTNNPSLSSANTDKVVDACKGQIDAAIKRNK